MKTRVLASVATSIDGFVDDRTSRRLILSSEADLREVYRLRAASHAVLVGAATIRADDPSLVTTHPEDEVARAAAGLPADPLKVTITRSGDLDPARRFFARGDGPKLVFCPQDVADAVRARFGSRAEVIAGEPHPARILAELARRGVESLMIEGGPQTLLAFFAADLVDELRWAVAPILLGARGGARFTGAGTRPLECTDVRRLGDTTVTRFVLGKSPRDHVRHAVDLAYHCPPTARAFSVGAVLVDRSGDIIGTGYSRERGPASHAEEVALARATERGHDPAGGVMYSTMEPCGCRLSGKKGCAERIVEAGVAEVVYVIPEPPVFVKPTGLAYLIQRGVGVRREARFEAEVGAQNAAARAGLVTPGPTD